MAGGVTTLAGEAQLRPVVRSYCAIHRDAVPEAFKEELEATGSLDWFSDPIAQLRPPDALPWLRIVDERLLGHLAGRRGRMRSSSGPCPHCDSKIAWGTGSHEDDAWVRNAVAWECHGCGPAGLADLD